MRRERRVTAHVFFVPGIPQPGGSKRAFVVAGHANVTEDAKRSKDWRASVALAGGELFAVPLAGPVALEFHFIFPRPRGHFGTGRNAGTVRPGAPRHHVTKPDCTKLARSTEDALKGIAWGDDSQVVWQVITKRYGDRPGCKIMIRELR
jgi:Holliday junction resolvase RusA-like endonuclease